MQIEGDCLVGIGRYTMFDPTKPEAANVSELVYFPNCAIDKDGNLTGGFAGEYSIIGKAHIVVEFFTTEEMHKNTIASLSVKKAVILADAQAKAAKVDEEIQSLRALTYKR